MLHRVNFSPKAEAQLVKLHKEISDRSAPAIGVRYTAAIVKYCLAFSTSPHRGTQRDDIRLGVRTVGYRRRATIAFEVANEIVTILGVCYGGQDYEADLQVDEE
jgi:toxin ParE1/3/4